MNTPAVVERRLRAANMLPPASDKPEGSWSSTVLLERIEEKVAGVETQERPATLAPAPNRRRRRVGSAAAAALAILVPVVLLAVFSALGERNDVAATPPDLVTTPPPTLPEPIQTDAPDVPFYARISADDILHDEDWAVIVFYRSPNCLPPRVNLLGTPGAEVSACGPPTVEGASIWENGPEVDSLPLATEFTGLGEVPVWIVPWPLLERVTADGVLTRRDLLAMQTRVEGTASTYHERVGSEGLDLAGSGDLVDGEPFSFSVSTDRSTSDVSVTLPFTREPVTAEDLEGAWENSFHRFEFAPDGTVRITVIGSRRSFGQADWPTGTVSEGTFAVNDGVFTITESTDTYCGEVTRSFAFDQVPGLTGEYYAQIGVDGLLVFDGIAAICSSVVDEEPANAPLTGALTRVE